MLFSFEKSPWDFDDNDKNNNFFSKNKKGKINFNQFPFDLNKKIISLLLFILFILWLCSGIYEVKEGEESIVIRFGKFSRKGTPGLNYHLPSPFEKIIIENINSSRRTEIGYRSGSNYSSSRYKNVGTVNFGNNSLSNSNEYKNVTAESSMLTGDENIIDLNSDVMWHIGDIEQYVFNISNPQMTVKDVCESAIREVIGNTPIASVLSSQKQEITNRIEALVQKILDDYKSGIVIEQVQLLKAEPPVEVIDAYRDVQTSRADKEREINQAQAYKNDILPRARGEAARILEEAEAYKQEIISRSEGDSKRFLSVYSEYINNKEATKARLQLESLEEILKEADKKIIGVEGTLFHSNLQK